MRLQFWAALVAGGLSAVLAVVTAGLYVGWRSSEISDARTRLRDGWGVCSFVEMRFPVTSSDGRRRPD